jgi:crossover junction endodeoxyribonuclease RuvC
MLILGIDPGTNKFGYGIIELINNKPKLIISGVRDFRKIKYLPTILDQIYKTIKELSNNYKIDIMSIENAFYHLNVDAVMKIGYARGAAMLSAIHSNIQIAEYSPREVKKSITGNGAATKQQVQYMVKQLLGIQKELKLDESDALAIAICHSLRNSTHITSNKKSDWKNFIQNNPGKVIL